MGFYRCTAGSSGESITETVLYTNQDPSTTQGAFSISGYDPTLYDEIEIQWYLSMYNNTERESRKTIIPISAINSIDTGYWRPAIGYGTVWQLSTSYPSCFYAKSIAYKQTGTLHVSDCIERRLSTAANRASIDSTSCIINKVIGRKYT